MQLVKAKQSKALVPNQKLPLLSRVGIYEVYGSLHESQ